MKKPDSCPCGRPAYMCKSVCDVGSFSPHAIEGIHEEKCRCGHTYMRHSNLGLGCFECTCDKSLNELVWSHFIPVNKLFPRWVTASIILREFCEKTGDWAVLQDDVDICRINIGLTFPLVRDELSGRLVPMFETFPLEDRERVFDICHMVMSCYTPTLEEMIGQKVNDFTVARIRDMIKEHECRIIAEGGRDVMKELKFRLGLEWS